MWTAIAIASASLSTLLAALWFRDHRRNRRERARLRQTVEVLTEQTRDLSAGEKSRQQTLFDGMAEGVLVVSENGRIEFLNLAFQRLLGLPKNARGRLLCESLALPEMEGMLRRVNADGQASGIELDLTRS